VEKFSLKSLLIIVVVLLIGIVALFRIQQSAKKVSAAWFNDTWQYRKAITLTNSGTGQTNVYVTLTIGTSDTARFQADAGDLRFTKQNGELLNYFIVSGAGTSSTVIHVNFDIYPAGASTFYLYYGNPYVANGFTSSDFTLEASNYTPLSPAVEERGGGPIAYWSFDEGVGTSVFDSSSNKINGYFYGNPQWKTESECLSNKCIYLDGSSNIRLPNAKAFGNTQYTVSAWVKLTNTGSSEYESLISFNGGGLPEMKVSHGTYALLYLNSGANDYYRYGNLDLKDNRWHNVQFVFDDSTNLVKMYVDTVNRTGAGPNGNEASVATSWIIGYGLKGWVDELKVYPYVRSLTQIKQDYAVGKAKVGGKGAGVAVGKDNTDIGLTPPIFYWDFNEKVGTTAFDKSGNTNLPISNATYTVGKIGGALQFNGNAWLEKAISPSIGAEQNYSQCLWFYPTSTASRQVLIDDSNQWEHWVAMNSNRTLMGCYYNTSQMCANTSTTANLNAWNHVCFTYENATAIKLYLNGILSATNTNIGTTLSKIYDDVCIGKAGVGSNEKFFGKIDEVKIYNYPLTQKQVLLDMNAGNPMSASKTPILWLKLNEGVGRTIVNFGSLGSVLNGYTIGNTTPTWVVGKEGKALSFDGLNAHFNVYNHNDLKINGQDKTISVWFNHSSSDNGGYILSKPWHGSGGYNWGITANTNSRITFSIGASTSWSVSPTTTYSKDTWNYLAISIQNPNVKIYLNGKKISDTNHTITDWNPNGGDSNVRLAVGCLYPYDASTCNSTGSAFGGLLDDIKIYNYALSDDEIKADYNQGAQFVMGKSNQTIGGTTTSLDYCIPGDTTACSPPIAQWNLEEGIGTSIYDTSGNNNNGISVGVTPPAWSIGKIGKGMSFSGNNLLNFPSLNWTPSAFTVEFWLNPSSRSDYNQQIGSTNGWGSFMFHTTTLGQIFVGTDITYRFGSAQLPANTLELNKWQHFAFAYGSGSGYFYKNGILLGTKNMNQSGAWGGFVLGRNNTLDGKIDQVKIYDYARTPAQVAYDYNGGKPVGWWKFDECEGTMINDWAAPPAGGGNTGALVIGAGGSQVSVGTCSIGDTSAWSNGNTGKINSAMSFDGNDDYVNIPNNPIFDLANNNYSISIWFKAAASMTDSPGMMLQRYTGGSPGAGYWVAISSNKVYFENRADGGDPISIFSNSSYNDNSWHQIIATVDTSTKTGKMYIDGNYMKSDTYTGNILNNNANLTLGGQGVSYSYNGLLDDVRIYNYALTSEQIKQVYNGGAVNFR